jgi:hypothetical protein
MGLSKIDTDTRYKYFKEKETQDANKKKDIAYSKENKRNIFEDSVTNEELFKFFEDPLNKDKEVITNEKESVEILNKYVYDIPIPKINNNFNNYINKNRNKNIDIHEKYKIDRKNFDDLYNSRIDKLKKSNQKNQDTDIDMDLNNIINKIINIEILRNESSLKFIYIPYEENSNTNNNNKNIKIEGVNLQINMDTGNVYKINIDFFLIFSSNFYNNFYFSLYHIFSM